MDAQALKAAVAVTRFGLGARPGDIAAATAHRAWLAAQVRREGADPIPGDWPTAQDRLATFTDFQAQVRALRANLALPALKQPASAISPANTDLFRTFQTARRNAKQPLIERTQAELLARAQLAATTPASFRERWTLFWSNHFSIGDKNEATALLAPVFEREAIRPYVFARFESLLLAAESHAAMLLYLDQPRSAGPNSRAGQRHRLGLNENLAREILELHTVSPDANYTQADVTEFARALTGASIANASDDAPVGTPLFRPNLHEPGSRTIMGRTYPGDGPEQVRAILADLAANPATARHLAQKIATHFVADTPPLSLVARLEAAYRDSGGDLAHLAHTLIASPEAWTPTAQKLKNPYEFLVSAWRATGSVPFDAHRDLLAPLGIMGMRPFSAPQPNGWPDQAPAWSAPDALIKRLYWSQSFANAWPAPADPSGLAQQALGPLLTPASAQAIARAESRPEGVALLLMTPEFQRR